MPYQIDLTGIIGGGTGSTERVSAAHNCTQACVGGKQHSNTDVETRFSPAACYKYLY